MTNKKTKIDIMISVHNEINNALNLLSLIKKQDSGNYTLNKIYILYSGEESFEINDEIVELIKHKERTSKRDKLNYTFLNSKSELLITIDADIIIKEDFLRKISEKYNCDYFDLAYAKTIPLRYRNIVEKTLFYIHEEKNYLIMQWNEGRNFIAGDGKSMILSKRLLQELKIPKDTGTDIYPYYECEVNGFKMLYLNDICINFSLVNNIDDYIKQKQRFKKNKKQIKEIFKKTSNIPFKIMFDFFIRIISKHPLLFLNFLYMNILVLISKKKEVGDYWSLSESSKYLKRD